MAESPVFELRRFPRFLLRHRVQVRTREGGLCLPGYLCDLSQEGCRLRLDGELAPGVPIEAHCDIRGQILDLRGETVWSEGPPGGVHGVAITGFASEVDAFFHRLYVKHLAWEKSAPLGFI